MTSHPDSLYSFPLVYRSYISGYSNWPNYGHCKLCRSYAPFRITNRFKCLIRTLWI